MPIPYLAKKQGGKRGKVMRIKEGGDAKNLSFQRKAF